MRDGLFMIVGIVVGVFAAEILFKMIVSLWAKKKTTPQDSGPFVGLPPELFPIPVDFVRHITIDFDVEDVSTIEITALTDRRSELMAWLELNKDRLMVHVEPEYPTNTVPDPLTVIEGGEAPRPDPNPDPPPTRAVDPLDYVDKLVTRAVGGEQ